MVEIILVRHGETDWNVAEVFRGRIDIGLNETGMKQAELLAEYLSDKKLEAVYSSPLKRALKTAEAIAQRHHLELNVTPGLNDMDFGEWQGLPFPEVKDKYQGLFADWVNHPERVRVPSGENLDDVTKRAMPLVENIIAKYEGSVVLVSHRVVNKVLICALLGLDNSHFWNIRQDICGITSFVYENGQFILTKHNDTSYLKPISSHTLNDF